MVIFHCYVNSFMLIHGSKKCHVNVTRLGPGGQVLVEEAMVFRSETVFSWPWWNILDWMIGLYWITWCHTSYQSYWVILSHTESYWVILSHTESYCHINSYQTSHKTHHESHPYRSTSLAKCTMRWSSSASGVARCWRCQRSRRQVQSFRVNFHGEIMRKS